MEITISKVVRWIVGLLFIIIALSSIVEGSFLAFLLSLLIVIVCIPVIADPIEKKLNFSMSGPIRFLLVFVLIIGFGLCNPNPTPAHTTPVANQSTDEHKSTIEVPASTPTPDQNNTQTATPTPENKGKLEIITNPNGATVTIDGVSQGTTPIKDLSMDAGTHTVDLYLSGYNLHKETVNLANSETKTILWDFVSDTSQNPTPTPKETPTETTTSDTTQAETSTQSTQTPKELHTIASWTGNGIKNTETFHASSDEWAIVWDTRPGKYGDMNFQIYVYNSDGTLKDVAANVIGASNDHTIERGAGDYYLNINTAQPYSITVKE